MRSAEPNILHGFNEFQPIPELGCDFTQKTEQAAVQAREAIAAPKDETKEHM